MPSHQLTTPGTVLSASIFHNLGQYSPWFPATDEQPELPQNCKVTLVSQLERHGSRYPTNGSYKDLAATLRQIAKTIKGEKLDHSLEWIHHWTLTKKKQDGGLRNKLGNSELVPFGQYEAFSSGRRFAERYWHLFTESYDAPKKRSHVTDPLCGESSSRMVQLTVQNDKRSFCRRSVQEKPFVRVSGADRVIASSRFWLEGFNRESTFEHAQPSTSVWPQDGLPSISSRPFPSLPQPDVIISEDRAATGASNNTLDVYSCPAFELIRGDDNNTAAIKVEEFAKEKTASISKRFERQGLGKLDYDQVLQLASLCAFDTVARLNPYHLSKHAISPWCALFKKQEFAQVYEVSTDLEKEYGFGPKQPFHKALATPWLRELLARIESRQRVIDPPTAINTSLPFPLDYNAYVDFTHDNQLAPIIASLNILNPPWNTATTTPFDGRLTVEKVECNQGQEAIRIFVNDKVVETNSGSWCPGAKHLTLCPVETFTEQLKWVDTPTEWNKCYQN